MRKAFLSFFIVTLSLALVMPMSAQGNRGAQAAASSGALLELPVPAGFSIQYGAGYKVITIDSPWPGASRTYRYVLYPRGKAKPAGVKADAYIETPARRVITFSTTYLSPIEAIGELGALKGVDSVDYVYNPRVRKMIADGDVVQTTKEWMPDIERIISLSPDLVLTYGMGNEWDTYPALVDAGLPVVFVGEWNEANPLARAEWAVYIAAFFNKEAQALESFSKVLSEYARLKALAASAATRPSTLLNGPFSGTWGVPAGESYAAALLADAGATYPWAGTKGTGSLMLSVEAVFDKAFGATFWLNASHTAQTVSDVRNLDSRFAAIPAVRSGNIWVNTLKTTPSGGNDYFESAVMQPQLVLADLIAIFHPELLPAHRFSYYRKLSE